MNFDYLIMASIYFRLLVFPGRIRWHTSKKDLQIHVLHYMDRSVHRDSLNIL